MPNPNIATALTALFEELLGSAQDVRIAAQHTPQFMQALDAEMAGYRARFEALIAPAVDTSAMLVATKAAVVIRAYDGRIYDMITARYGPRISTVRSEISNLLTVFGISTSIDSVTEETWDAVPEPYRAHCVRTFKQLDVLTRAFNRDLEALEAFGALALDDSCTTTGEPAWDVVKNQAAVVASGRQVELQAAIDGTSDQQFIDGLVEQEQILANYVLELFGY